MPGNLYTSQSLLLMQDYFLGAALSTESLSGVGALGSQIAAVLN